MAHIQTPIPTLELNDGNKMPMLFFGSGTHWMHTGDGHGLVESIKIALKMGFVAIDTSETYGNEAEVGKALKESKVARDKVFVTAKVDESVTGNISEALDKSLNLLQLDYVDLYLIHQPYIFKSDTDLQKAWTTMETIKASGRARSIGVSNFKVSHLEAIMKNATVPPVINQVEFHAYLQHRSGAPSLLDYHKQHNIATEAYAPLTPVKTAKPGPVDALLAGLAKKYYVSEGDICIRWCLDQNIAVVTTSSKESRISEYLRATTFSLTPKEVEQINEAGQQKHFRGFKTDHFDKDDRS